MAKGKLDHFVRYQSLVRIGCNCGWFWSNEKLRGKNDLQLMEEVEIEFLNHQLEMEKAGY